MESRKSFLVFGEKVEVVVPGETTDGASSMMIQTSPPGGGPPPHRHQKEDEFFCVLEGTFEMLTEGEWSPVTNGEMVFAPRNHWHTFRNAGDCDGRMQVIVRPSGLEKYLEAISPLVLPDDMDRLMELSDQFGIEYLPAPNPS
jgi:quercetin dioxygenase-like cupin family protein